MSHKIDLAALPLRIGTSYPAPHDAPCKARESQAIGMAGGLSQFGVNMVRLKPGVWTGQRHWHSDEDEFVWVMEGQATLITDEGREVFNAGDCACFPAGVPNAHHFCNEGNADVLLLTVGTRSESDVCHYPEVDLEARPGRYTAGPAAFVHKDGSPYSDAPE